MTVKGIWSELKPLNVISRKAWLTVGLAVLAMTATMVSQTTGSQIAPRANRITQSTTSGASVKLAGSVHPRTKVATDLGSVESVMPMDSMTLNIGLSASQQTEVNALLKALQDPQSPKYHQWLTQEQYGARFGLTDADLSAVTSWLKSQGFTVKSVAPSRNVITFSGKAWQTESAFHTELHRYQIDGETHFANATELRIPAALASVVTHVSGLNSFRPKARTRALKPNFTSGQSGVHSLTPGDWATIYDVAPIYTAGYTGTSQHIAIVGQTYIPQTDIDKFRAAAGLPATNLTYKCISSTHCTDAAGENVDDVVEADLDVEWGGGIAKDATVDYIYASAADTQLGVFDALIYAITKYKANNAVVPVISMSYGDCEMSESASYTTAFTNYTDQAALQSQTILNSSGDQGAVCVDYASNANPPTVATSGPAVSWPASSPGVTAVGGTTFSADGTGQGDLGADAYWSYSSSADIISSAIQYIPETSWNDTAAEQAIDPTSTFSSGGGGVSLLYQLPSWQWSPSNYSGAPMRFLPDVSFSASPDHDPYLVCTQNFTGTTVSSSTGSTCVNGFRYSDGTLVKSYFGGTSASTPSFAGMLTLLVEKYGPQGNINPTLYALAKNATTYATVFHDITGGTNKQPCTTGTPGCVSNLVGYSSTIGYDLVTGLGSVDGFQLYTALGAATTSGTPTTTSVTAAPSSVATGGTTTLTATVNNTSATGTVTFKVGSQSLGTSALSGGVATLGVTVTTGNGFTVGSDTITAIYAGDTNYSGSSGTTTLAVAVGPTYTLTATPMTLTGSSAVTLTLTASNGYTGTVGLVAVVTSTNGTASNVTATLSSSSLSLASGSGTSTLTVTASASAATHAPAMPWKSGGALVFAVVLGAPFTVRRKRALAVLLTAFVISLAGLMVACGGGGGGSSSSTTPVKTARTYTVTVTPTGSGTVVLNPSPVQITVTVQ